MLDKSKISVLLFERPTEAKAVYFTTFSLEGRILAEGVLEYPDVEGFARHFEESSPTDVNMWAPVWPNPTREKRECVKTTEKIVRVQYIVDHDILADHTR